MWIVSRDRMAIASMRCHMDTRTRAHTHHNTMNWCERPSDTKRKNEEKLDKRKNLYGRKASKQAPIYVAWAVFCIYFSKYDTKHCNICDMLPLSILITCRIERPQLTDRCHSMSRRKMCQILQYVSDRNSDKYLFKIAPSLTHSLTRSLIFAMSPSLRTKTNK